MKLGEQSIFPLPEANIGGAHFNATSGMTLRQYYAGLAMQAYIIKGLEGSTAHAIIATDAVRSADALLNELEK